MLKGCWIRAGGINCQGRGPMTKTVDNTMRDKCEAGRREKKKRGEKGASRDTR